MPILNRTYVLDDNDLRNIAENVWRNNAWFERGGSMVLLETLKNELLGAVEEYAEREDAANGEYEAAEARRDH